MANIRTRPGELSDMFTHKLIKVCTHCQAIRAAANILSWDVRVYVTIARFAGHLARVAVYDESRLVLEILRW